MPDSPKSKIPIDLPELGWKPFFDQQLTVEESGRVIGRVHAHHGKHLGFWSPSGEFSSPIELFHNLDEVTVGDWVLFDEDGIRPVKLLERQSLLTRKAAGEEARTQLMAANIDSLFIVSSCNQEFNLNRLERYLAIALDSGANPVVVLTKADLCDDVAALQQQVQKLHRDLIVEALDARDADAVADLEYWCRKGQSVAVVGSSGVGKSTLANSMGARDYDSRDQVHELKTGGIRDDDDKGRHTTTSRSMYLLRAGGLLIDSPGIRELQLPSCAEGVTEVFDDVVQIAAACRFRDCSHSSEPGCAVNAAVANEELDPRRVANYQKLISEQARNAETLAQRRQRDKALGRFYKSVQAQSVQAKKGRRGEHD